MNWDFWIDVGGTFTDCVARSPTGDLRTFKILSSGSVKGTAVTSHGPSGFIDPARANDPEGIWNGYDLRVIGRAGEVIARRRVRSFSQTEGFTLDWPLSYDVPVGTFYELHSGEESPIVAIRYLLGLRLDETIPPVKLRLGTTRGTNALLERRGARVAFLTTRGFADLLLIGNQNRPRLFDLSIQKSSPLFTGVVEVDERITPDGHVLVALNSLRIRDQLSALRYEGIESVAICLLHAYINPAHELLVEQLAYDVGFVEVSRSSQVAPLIKAVARGDTTVVDAYLNPVLRDYVQTLRRGLCSSNVKITSESSSFRVMTSAGGLVDADHFIGKDSLLSGPAGGVVGLASVTPEAGFSRAIGFDMGGTSTDVSRFAGQFEREFETEKGGVRIVAPMMAIETVAAGGGSICRFDGVKLVVGPESAGADPGPASYGRGGPLTVTDVNLLLGRIPRDHFPFRLDLEAVEARLADITQEMRQSTGITTLTCRNSPPASWRSPMPICAAPSAKYPSPRDMIRPIMSW